MVFMVCKEEIDQESKDPRRDNRLNVFVDKVWNDGGWAGLLKGCEKAPHRPQGNTGDHYTSDTSGNPARGKLKKAANESQKMVCEFDDGNGTEGSGYATAASKGSWLHGRFVDLSRVRERHV